jgi:DNA-binding LacI/PurR family transcriptional regulator
MESEDLETEVSFLDHLTIDADRDQTLWLQLKRQLMWLIASGQVQPGEKLPSVRQLANHLGINFQTVRVAYQKLEAEGLVAIRHGSGTVALEFDPLRVAQRASGARTHTVGVLVPRLRNPFYPAFLQGVEDIARRSHMLLFICNTDDDPPTGKAYLDLLVAKQVDGLILAPCGLAFGHQENPTSLDQAASPVPIVYVDRPGETGYAVLLDSEGAGCAATRHLLQHGHRRIGLVTCFLDSPTIRQSFLGYTQALEEAGLGSDPDLVAVASVFTIAAGYEAAQVLLDASVSPTAIFSASDVLAFGVMQAIKERGLRIPEDIALVGYNDLDIASLAEPALTTVAAPMHELGATAMFMLHRLISGKRVEERQITLPTNLVIRGTCGCQS